MQPPLELQDFWIDELIIQANKEFKPTKTANWIAPEIGFEILKAPRKKEFLICMKINMAREEKIPTHTPYQIGIILSGLFRFVKGTNQETINKMIAPNGLAILYGMARSTIAQATACGRNGKFLFPAVNLIEVIRLKAKNLDKGKEE